MESTLILGREIFDQPIDFYINTCSYEVYNEILVHKHDFIELNYVSNGSGIHRINGMHYDVSKGDFYLIPTGMSHVFLPYDLCNTKKLTTINCIFYPDFIFENDNFSASKFFQEIYSFISLLQKENKTDLLCFRDTADKTVEKLLYKMQKEYKNNCLGNIEIIKMNLLELIIQMKRYTQTQTFSKDFTSYNIKQLINVAIEYLEENYLNPISLEDVSNYVMLSKCYFSTQFKKITGKTVIQYLQEIRMKKASELLLKSNYSVTTISQMVGYNDYNFFTQTFKKVIGITPREYRKQRLF